MDEFRQVDLTHHRRHDMGVLQVEVVVRAIEVRRHHGDVVRAVLQVVTLAHLQAGNLRDGVLLVRVLQWAGEETVLLHRLRGILGIDAGGAEEEQFLDIVGVGFADHIALDLHVHHDEVGAVEAVGHDTADEGGGQHHGVRTLFVEELLDGVLVGQVEFLVAATHEVGIAALL